MEKREDRITKKHNDYVFNMQVRKSELLDLFLNKELNEEEFKQMMDGLQEWYKRFIANILNDNWQLELDL